MFAWTKHTSLKLPAAGKVTVKVCPFSREPVVTHVEPSKVADPSSENPGHPTWRGRRVWPDFRKLTVWISSVGNVQVMLSPARTQISFGRKANSARPLSLLWTPTGAL